MKRKSRPELVAEYRALLAQGYSVREVAALLGKTRGAVYNLLADPDGAQQRARRERYRGTCEDCGARTDGSSGLGKAPRLCMTCENASRKVWTRERVIAAIQRWAALHGRPPKADEWRVARTDDWRPGLTSVYRTQRHPTSPFASWADAIEAAGFPRPVRGHWQDESTERRRAAYAAAKQRGAAS